MRTHLLRTVYSLMQTELESAMDVAANDASYCTDDIRPMKTTLSLIKPAAVVDSANDDYELGGYAGI